MPRTDGTGPRRLFHMEVPMARVCVPQALCGGFDHPIAGRLIARKGILDVPDHVARDLIKHDGCFPMADHPRGVGFVCGTCGFHGYFKQCGRCGNACHRPQPKEQHDG